MILTLLSQVVVTQGSVGVFEPPQLIPMANTVLPLLSTAMRVAVRLGMLDILFGPALVVWNNSPVQKGSCFLVKHRPSLT